METRPAKGRRFALGVALSVVLAAAALAFVPAASESPINHGLFAYVVATNQGPLSACSGNDCTPANNVWHFIYVVNTNRLTNLAGGTSRATLPNSFVVGSVEWRVFANGVEISHETFTPPPNAYLRSWSGHWPSTVTCPRNAEGVLVTPCNVVGSPAVVPGEDAAVLYTGWSHGSGEPNGTYVFRFTVHGTLNGTPVDLTATSQPIVMTP